MSGLPVVAIAGGTGNLGSHLTKAFLLPEFRNLFNKVIVLARSESPKTEEFADAGAEIRTYSDDDIAPALDGVQVLVNAVGASGHHFKEILLRAIPQTSIKMYFPSEFGVNHYVHDFPHEEWDAKKNHFKIAQQVIPNVRVCRVFAGLFLEDSIGPWFGFHTSKCSYEAVGSPTQRTSYTSLDDVGRAVTIMASLNPSDIPDEINLSGDSKSFIEIARIMEDAGSKPITVSSIPLESYRSQVLSNPKPTPERYLRFLMGEGNIDHTESGLGNGNKLIESHASFGKWKSMQDLARETKGVPWGDLE